MFDFDLRTFTSENRAYFWQACQSALSKLIVAGAKKYEGDIFLLTILLDMRKRIEKGEESSKLNHYSAVLPNPNEKLGPGW